MPSKVYIVDSSYAYVEMFKKNGFDVCHHLSMKEVDLICFTGGEDVSPDLYGEDKHPRTYFNQNRDFRERIIVEDAIQHGVPMVGICRGGQFLNVMNGGKMYQHVGNHTASHNIYDLFSKRTLLATSTHHQMMRPHKDAIVVATADQYGFKEYMDDNGVCVHHGHDIDIEVVFYPATQSLCFQPHPEFGSDELEKYFFTLINRYINL